MEVKFLYHGTAAKYLSSIKERGILPRSISRIKSNWGHTLISNKDAVYLTDAYAWHFAGAASKKGDAGLILEIDRDRLFEWWLCPDEDFMEQASRKIGPTKEHPLIASTEWDMKKRTMHYRKLARHNPHMTDISLENMGTCAYYNEIPWDAITRYVVIDWSKLHPSMKWRAFDSQVSMMNYRILQAQHRAFTRWFFGDDIRPDELTGIPLFKEFDAPEIFKRRTEETMIAMAMREGLINGIP